MTPITENWLRENGFKWHEMERQGSKHWVLWIGDATKGVHSFEDLGIELAHGIYNEDRYWMCWLRGDYCGRYSRFIHIGDYHTIEEVISLAEGLTHQKWDTANNLYGSMITPERAARYRAEEEKRKQRLDVKILESRPWYEIEKDPARDRALPEHMQGAIDGGKAK